MDDANTGDDTGRGGLAVVLIVCDEQPYLEEARAVVAQASHPLTRGKLSLFVELCHPFCAAALTEAIFQSAQLRAQRAQTGSHFSRP